MSVGTPAPSPVAMSIDDVTVSPVERVVGPWEVTPANDRVPVFEAPPPSPSVMDPAHKKMIDALVAGDSLNSAERTQLFLALARVLLQKGFIRAEDLARALASNG